MATNAQVPRDPRFDPRVSSGSKDSRRRFDRNYAFLDDLRKTDLSELERALRNEREPEKKAQIKTAIQRIRSKLVERDNRNKRIELETQIKAKHKNVNKSYIKKKLLVEKFKELKSSGKLTKYLERKRKKLINRDGKAFED